MSLTIVYPTLEALINGNYDTTKVARSLFDANTVLAANADDTPLALTVGEQTVVGRLTGGNIAAVAIGIADDNILQVDGSPSATRVCVFSANGVKGYAGLIWSDGVGLTVGAGEAGVDYVLVFNGETNDGTVTWMEDEPYFKLSHALNIQDPGSLLGTPVAGTFEFDNDRMYITNVGTQRALDRTSDVITSTTTVSDTVTETTLYTGTIGANDFKVGNLIKVRTNGVISNATASDDITISVYIGSTQVDTYNPAIGNVTNAIWNADFELTVRSVGASGSIAFHGDLDINDNTTDYDQKSASIQTIDTTAAEDLTVKVQWDNAKAGNTISIYQGHMEFKN